MSLKKKIRALLKEYDISPNKLKGQHFLVHTKTLKDIAEYANVQKGDRVVEVGAGVGNLTHELLATGVEVFAIENDPQLVVLLKKEFKDAKNLHIVAQDVLEYSEENVATPYTVVGNIPYYITGPIIQKFIESPHQPERLVLTIQKEVAENIIAEPPKATFLSTVVSLFGTAEYKQTVAAKYFWPEPGVDSAVIIITPHTATQDIPEDLVSFIRAGFSHPRKTLANNLGKVFSTEKTLIVDALKNIRKNPRARAHELSLRDWHRLFTAVYQ